MNRKDARTEFLVYEFPHRGDFTCYVATGGELFGFAETYASEHDETIRKNASLRSIASYLARDLRSMRLVSRSERILKNGSRSTRMLKRIQVGG